jgi:hypothetical protein
VAFLKACIKQIDELPSHLLDTAWNCKSELLAIVEAECLIQPDDADGHATLGTQASKAVDVLAQVNTGKLTQHEYRLAG